MPRRSRGQRRHHRLKPTPAQDRSAVSALLGRRVFLGLSLGAFAGVGRAVRGDESPHVALPRATDGDDRQEPNWEERLTVTVGPRNADLVGRTDKVIQAAVDYVARLGGGTVDVLPGEYSLRHGVVLASGVRLRGAGADTRLVKAPSVTTELADDSDWYDQEITLRDSAGFQVGDAVVLRAKNPDNGAAIVIKRTLVARSGNRFKLNDGLRENLWLSGRPTCSRLHPLLTSERTSDVVLERLTLCGDKDRNELLDGNYAGCVFLQDCNRYTLRELEASEYNGDGISFQICHDVVVERCHSHDHTGLGLHPGSGSQRPVLRDNRLERNDIGLFWCWGVKFGLAEGNEIVGNRGAGISIGHNDTDNVMRRNRVVGSGRVGVLFRDDPRGRDFWANRNRLEQNEIIDSGDEQGVAIDLQGQTREVTLRGNEVRETRGAAKRVGVRIGAECGAVALEENRFAGFATEIEDRR